MYIGYLLVFCACLGLLVNIFKLVTFGNWGHESMVLDENETIYLKYDKFNLAVILSLEAVDNITLLVISIFFINISKPTLRQISTFNLNQVHYESFNPQAKLSDKAELKIKATAAILIVVFVVKEAVTFNMMVAALGRYVEENFADKSSSYREQHLIKLSDLLYHSYFTSVLLKLAFVLLIFVLFFLIFKKF